MAEECQYYHYDSSPWGYGYTCLLKQSQDKDRTIDSDWVHKYCWNYNYNDCPFYQAKHGGQLVELLSDLRLHGSARLAG